MISKEILNAQLELYKKGREQAMSSFEKTKNDIMAFNGAIEACENLIRVNEGLENPQESSEENKEVK